MGFASFVFYAKKNGLNFQKQGSNSLSFHYSGGRYYAAKIMPGKDKNDCGYIVLNCVDYEILFGKNILPVDLATNETVNLKQCKRPKEKKPDGSREHCNIDESLWGKIEASIDGGDKVQCKRTVPEPSQGK